ncbi:MAG: bifunctional glutamate N-acetyltransferase/amino-acid acetyltransferase ArgJ [Lachnospiraceae bacterium]|nr:bifunctional glutamate N-acetyltransferase/amino-acid acetyltransferase ArgJ [Lachnospiraceae bacterium]
MKKKQIEGYTYVDGGVCAAKGFVANGLNCGINPDKNKNDLGMIYSVTLCDAAAVYTQNKVKGAPVVVTKNNLEKSGAKAQAVIVNSKNANTCNANGIEVAEEVCKLTAAELKIQPEQVIVGSTGVIGQPMSVEPFAAAMADLAAGLSVEGHDAAATAIMTTDTVKKEVAVEFEIDGKTCRLGGMAKGSGMIHPNMATTLNFVTTDVAISGEMLQKALSEIVKVTYNCLSIDGDTSTNDMVSVMANGMAGNDKIVEEGKNYKIVKQALHMVMEYMTMMLAADGEGASKFLECSCDGAPDQETAIIVAKSVIRSPLVKCAMFGEDANCGRILCAIGYAEADVDVSKIELELASENDAITTYKDGFSIDFSEEKAAEILKEKELYIRIHLHQGEASAKAWGCDFTYDYVKINGDYRS